MLHEIREAVRAGRASAVDHQLNARSVTERLRLDVLGNRRPRHELHHEVRGYHHCAVLQMTADPKLPIDARWPKER